MNIVIYTKIQNDYSFDYSYTFWIKYIWEYNNTEYSILGSE